ncbi:MAG: glutamyl-tRNA reductase [Gammaproteobacteria bacterium]|nr:glutamyl-tRNA reductase [Gammaproteobacteria bacterium]MCP5200440.1 glutamyl-tRNA reductase [Gammaproteobacteria bacterium]
MALNILGLSHKTAPLAVREKVAFDAGQLADALDALNASRGVSEAMILSTCNRTELYCNLDVGAAREPLSWLTRYRGLGDHDIEPHIYQLQDEHAVRHVLRVASGLDSLVVGEPQILGQLKDAYRSAVDAGTVGKFLNRLMQFSFSTAKMIRSSTDIGNTPVSVAYAAVKLAQQIHGDLSRRRALLVGAGETIALVANHLKGAGIGRLVIANRSHENAVALAERHGGEAIALTSLPERLPQVDIVVASTASRLPIITRGIVEVALERRRFEPMFFVDLAVPRDIEPAVGDIDDAYLYTVDDLESVVSANLRVRHEAAAQAEEMVHLQVQDYMDWLQVQSSGATIASFRARGEGIRDELLERAHARLERGDDARAVLDQLANTLTNKLMHHPTASLRQASGREDFLRVARELLGLEDSTSPKP